MLMMTTYSFLYAPTPTTSGVLVSTDSPRDIGVRLRACARALFSKNQERAPVIVIVPRRVKELGWKKSLASEIQCAGEKAGLGTGKLPVYLFSLEALITSSSKDSSSSTISSSSTAGILMDLFRKNMEFGKESAKLDVIVDLTNLDEREEERWTVLQNIMFTPTILPHIRTTFFACERPIATPSSTRLAGSYHCHYLLSPVGVANDESAAPVDGATPSFLTDAIVTHAALYVELPLFQLEKETVGGELGTTTESSSDPSIKEREDQAPSFMRTVVAKKTAAVVKDIVLKVQNAKTAAERNMQAFVVISPTKFGIGSDAFGETLLRLKQRKKTSSRSSAYNIFGREEEKVDSWFDIAMNATSPNSAAASSDARYNSTLELITSVPLYSSVQQPFDNDARSGYGSSSTSTGGDVPVYLVDDGVHFDDPVFFSDRLRGIFETKSMATIYFLQPNSHGSFLNLVETIQSFSACSISQLHVVYVLTQHLVSPDTVLQDRLTTVVQLLSSMGGGGGSSSAALRGTKRDMSGEYVTAMYKFNSRGDGEFRAAQHELVQHELVQHDSAHISDPENSPVNEIRFFVHSVEHYMKEVYPALRKFFSEATRLYVSERSNCSGSSSSSGLGSGGNVDSNVLLEVRLHDMTEEYDRRIAEQMRNQELASERATGGMMDEAFRQGDISSDEFFNNEQRNESHANVRLQVAIGELQSRAQEEVIVPLANESSAIQMEMTNATNSIQNVVTSAAIDADALITSMTSSEAMVISDTSPNKVEEESNAKTEAEQAILVERKALEQSLADDHAKLQQELDELNKTTQALLKQTSEVINGSVQKAQIKSSGILEQHTHQIRQVQTHANYQTLQLAARNLQTTNAAATTIGAIPPPMYPFVATTSQRRSEQSALFKRVNAQDQLQLQRYATVQVLEKTQRPAFREDWDNILKDCTESINRAVESTRVQILDQEEKKSFAQKASELVANVIALAGQRYSEYKVRVAEIAQAFVKSYLEQEAQRILLEAKKEQQPKAQFHQQRVDLYSAPKIDIDEAAAPEKLFAAEELVVPETIQERKPRMAKVFLKSEKYIDCMLHSNVTDLHIRGSRHVPSVLKALIFECNRLVDKRLSDSQLNMGERTVLGGFSAGEIVKSILKSMMKKQRYRSKKADDGFTLNQYGVFLTNWHHKVFAYFQNKTKGPGSLEVSSARALAAMFPTRAVILSPKAGVDTVLLIDPSMSAAAASTTDTNFSTDKEEGEDLYLIHTTADKIAEHVQQDGSGHDKNNLKKNAGSHHSAPRWLLCVAKNLSSGSTGLLLKEAVRAAAIAPEDYDDSDCTSGNKEKLEFSVEDGPAGRGVALQTKVLRVVAGKEE